MSVINIRLDPHQLRQLQETVNRLSAAVEKLVEPAGLSPADAETVREATSGLRTSEEGLSNVTQENSPPPETFNP